MNLLKFTPLLLATLLLACNSKPKVIEAVDDTEENQPPIVDESATTLHKVMVNEILPTSRYTYLNVTEDGEAFWIAIPKSEVEKGGPYYYRGGLKKVNFKSVEYDRVFETVYLVSGISKDPNMTSLAGGNPHQHMNETPATNANTKIEPPPGGITIAELLKNAKKYEGQSVRVRGKVVKLNNMIMNRNWIHLRDASVEGGQQDITITTTDQVQMDQVVAFEGIIAVNKDFGAGYKYEVIMEEAHLLQ